MVVLCTKQEGFTKINRSVGSVLEFQHLMSPKISQNL